MAAGRNAGLGLYRRRFAQAQPVLVGRDRGSAERGSGFLRALREDRRIGLVEIGQVEPLLQKINAQHPFHPDQRPAISGFRIERRISPHNAGHGTTCSISAKNRARRVVLAYRSNPGRRQGRLSNPPNLCLPHYIMIVAPGGFCRGSLERR